VVFRSQELVVAAPHPPAVQSWLINRQTPGMMGPIDRNGLWWLLDSYEAERRPLHRRVIAEATSNMATLAPELLADGLDRPRLMRSRLVEPWTPERTRRRSPLVALPARVRVRRHGWDGSDGVPSKDASGADGPAAGLDRRVDRRSGTRGRLGRPFLR
jgi:hypothetical protein